jgi:hypothetical protein
MPGSSAEISCLEPGEKTELAVKFKPTTAALHSHAEMSTCDLARAMVVTNMHGVLCFPPE